MNTPLRFAFACWMLLASVVGSPTPCIAADMADGVITLHADSELKRPTVRLSDLFNGVPAIIDREIAQAPLPGKNAVYESRVLTKLAEKYRLDWQPQSVSDHVTLTVAASHVTTDAIRDALIRSIRAEGVKGNLDVAFDGHPPQLDLPADRNGAFTLANFDYDAVGKRFRAELNADGPLGQILLPLAGKAVIKHRVPVLSRKLEGGTMIAAADIDWIEADDDKMNLSVVTDADSLIGRELRHTVADGELLHSGDVMPPRLVKRGSIITMKIETALMSLTAQGKALQDGTEGETVRVLNTQSNRMIEAVVSGPDTVIVHTAQRLAAIQ